MTDRSSLRIIVFGAKRWTDVDAVRGALMVTWQRLGPNVPPSELTIVTGGVPGASDIAEKWAHIHGAKVERHEANWTEVGEPRGDNMDNAPLINAGGDIALAFWGGSVRSSGTHDCIVLATRAGIPVFVVPKKRRKA